MNFSKMSKLLPVVMTIFISIIFFVFYLFYKDHLSMKEELVAIRENIYKTFDQEQEENFGDTNKSSNVPSSIRTNPWLQVEQKAKDSVVQVFTEISRFNWIEPYKTPEQGSARGSGFFIDENGHILTNFHVIHEASSINIQIPTLGKEQLDVTLVGVSPDRDIALLKLTKESYKRVKDALGYIPFLEIGDSDKILRSQEVLVHGYPLGQEVLKSTQGIISGREWIPEFGQAFFQITAPINPGNSGGPAFDMSGKVIGVTTAGVLGAQNVGYIIPINDIKSTIRDLHKVKFLRKPILGAIFTLGNKNLVKYLGNPGDGGWYVAHLLENGLLKKVGVRAGDMLYEINGFRVDLYGEVSVPWSQDKVNVLALLSRYVVGDTINMVLYRNGTRKEVSFKLEPQNVLPIRKVLPDFEKVDYEVFGGMVIMNLTLHHVFLMLESSPFLMRYTKPEFQDKPALIITHILPNSEASKSYCLAPGAIIEEVNGVPVQTLDEFRNAIRKYKHKEFVTIKSIDRVVDHMFVALSLKKILLQEHELSSRYFYKQSSLIAELKKELYAVKKKT